MFYLSSVTTSFPTISATTNPRKTSATIYLGVRVPATSSKRVSNFFSFWETYKWNLLLWKWNLWTSRSHCLGSNSGTVTVPAFLDLVPRSNIRHMSPSLYWVQSSRLFHRLLLERSQCLFQLGPRMFRPSYSDNKTLLCTRFLVVNSLWIKRFS